MMTKLLKCPRCNRKILFPNETHNALSRADNKTFVCSDCGMEEAFIDMVNAGLLTISDEYMERDRLFREKLQSNQEKGEQK